jgi:hypothetical protein
MSQHAEDSLYKQVGVLMKICYPDAIYRFDFGAGAYLNKNYRLMSLQKSIQMDGVKYPDFFLAEPVMMDGDIRHGLYLEMKAEGEKIFKKDGSYVSDHVRQQAECLKKLQDRGYWAMFAIGIHSVQDIIDSYLSFTSHQKMRVINFGPRPKKISTGWGK